MGGHGSFGSVSSSLMGVTLGYPSGHPDPRSSLLASVVESQSTADSAATITSTVSADTSDISTTDLLARQPPVDIETAAATNPTHIVQPVVRPVVQPPVQPAAKCKRTFSQLQSLNYRLYT